MTAFVWQTLLLLGLAYVLGCWIACLLRRMLGGAARTVEAGPADAVPAGAIAGAAAAGAALRPAPVPVVPPQPARQPVPAPAPVRDAFRRADTLEPSAEAARSSTVTSASQASSRTAQSAGAVDRFERALTGSGAGRAASSVPAIGGPDTPTPLIRGPNDLKRIRGIDAGIEAALDRLGVRTFAQIGAWKKDDVARISKALGFKGRIEQENWIEQAQILSTGKDTYYSSRLGLPQTPQRPAANDRRGPAPATASVPVVAPPVRPVTSAAAPSGPSGGMAAATATAAAMAAAAAAAKEMPTAAAAKEVPTAVPPDTPLAKPTPAADAAPLPAEAPTPRPAVPVRDDLRRIQGITPEIEQLLNSLGVTRFAQVARWTAADIERIGGLLGQPARIEREDWIAQAARLEQGGAAEPVGEVRPQQTVTRAQAPSQPVPAAPPSPPASSVVSASVAGAAVASLAAAAGERTAEPSASDRPATEPLPAEEVSAEPSEPGQPRSELGHLRSVRSEGLRGAQSPLDPRTGGGMDDLKRIRGIGVLIEKKLNSMGVTRYEQIAKWTSTDIDRVSHVLDFKGRIERENWVEQARILASGGQTEFSRRADRGEFGGGA